MLKIGDLAPDFSLFDHQGNRRSLMDYSGKWLVVWWYPKACSSVCSVQGRNLSQISDQLRALEVYILGISFDDSELNAVFAEQESLDFPLLSDLSMTVGAAYEVQREPGAPYADAPLRVTYIVDPRRAIRRSYLVTDVDAHPQVLLRDLRELLAEQ